MKSAYAAAALAAVIAAGLVAPAAYNGVRAAAQEMQMIHPANWGGHGHGDRGWGRHMDAAHVEGWIAFVQAELAIVDSQQPQWQAFADALRQAAAEMRALRGDPTVEDDGEEPPLSAPERLDRMERFAATGLEAIQRVKEPFTALYAALTDDQKGRADRLLDHRRRR